MSDLKQPGKLPKFIKHLYDICMVGLSHQNQDIGDAVVWDEASNSFIIVDLEFFTSKVLGMYFSHNNLSSFVRQLNHYGFGKVARNDELVQYFHKDFILGNYKRLYNFTKPKSSEKEGMGSKHDHCEDMNNCSMCKKLSHRVDKLEYVVRALMRELKEIKLVNKSILSNYYKEKE